MGVAAKAPLGGIVAQLGERSYPLVLRNQEIERFEERHNLGVFSVSYAFIDMKVQARHCRDLLALGLIGAGRSDMEADRIVSEIAPHHNTSLREAARELLWAAFVDPNEKKSAEEPGLVSDMAPTDTTPATDSPTPAEQG